MELPGTDELQVPRVHALERRFTSPLQARGERFVDDEDRVLVGSRTSDLAAALERGEALPAFERAGPRPEICYDPATLTCGVVTCGGLCPGVNDVIRSLVLTLYWRYGVRRILGFRYGYAGLAAAPFAPPLELTIERVVNIHTRGGTLLGSSRGGPEAAEMVDTLARHDVGVLFTIGGDGTLRGGTALAAEIARRGLGIGVVGVPKTIDNDLLWIEQSFGFATAVDEAQRAIEAAHAEARGAWNGIGLVKLMGRESGFIAAHASLANSDVNFCLVPEVPFTLDGRGGFLDALTRRLRSRRHAVVVVAEGALQDELRGAGASERDAGGNVKLLDVGRHLKERITAHFETLGEPITIKYIDPSYIIRSLPANAYDSEYCLILGQHAAHAGMAGRTAMTVGYWNRHFTHVPSALVTASRKCLDPEGETWQRVCAATGQPSRMMGEG